MIVSMEVEETQSEGDLPANWRGDISADATAAASMGEQQQQRLLPFKHKKATSSTETGGGACKRAWNSDATSAGNMVVVAKEESKFMAASPARPVICLSDSEGTPVRPCLAGRRGAVANSRRVAKASSSAWRADAEVVNLDSDSDEAISSDSRRRFPGKVDKVRETPSQREVDELREPTLDRALPEKFVSLDDQGSKCFGVAKSPSEPISRGALFENVSTPLKKGMASSKFFVLPDEPVRPVSQGVLSEKVIPPHNVGVEGSKLYEIAGKPSERISQGDFLKIIPSLDVENVGKKRFSLTLEFSEDEVLQKYLPNLLGEGEDPDVRKKVPLLNISNLESQEKRFTTVSSISRTGTELEDSAMRQYMQVVQDLPRNRTSSPSQRANLDLTNDDDRWDSEPESLRDVTPTNDDNACDSEPEWLRGDLKPKSLEGSLNSGGSVAHNFREQGCHDQFLLTSEGNREGNDHGALRRCSLVNTGGLSSDNYLEKTLSSSAKDREPGEGLAVEDNSKRKRHRRVPDDEVAARESHKVLERELKKARQDEEKRAREQKREELKRQKEEEKKAREEKRKELKCQKEAAKAEAAEGRRAEKENNRYKTGKFALENTTAHLDTTVVEMKVLGPLILQQLGSKSYHYKIGSNPIQRTIVWKMRRPSRDALVNTDEYGSQADSVINSQVSNSQLALEEVEMNYVLVVLQGEEFASLVGQKTLYAHLTRIRQQYPTYSICYLIGGLLKYVNKKDQRQYKAGESWTRPNVEQALAEFITYHHGVQSRLCIDDSDMADHVVGLTRSLAECPYKPKLSAISVHANGEHLTKSDPNKDVIRRSTWLKFLVAIPGVNGAAAIAVAKEFPTMRALLNAYLDPCRTVRDKETLLQNLVKDTMLGVVCADGRRVGPVMSKRIYRLLMAKNGDLTTEEAEEGADY